MSDYLRAGDKAGTDFAWLPERYRIADRGAQPAGLTAA